MSPHVPVTGGCLCGAVRYESQEAPTEGYYCHCRTCQKHYGNLFGATVRMPEPAFKFTKGQPKYYRSSDIAKRGFCSECGTPLVFAFETMPDAWVSIGSLDHPEDWPLSKQGTWGQVTHVRADRRIPWNYIVDGLPQRTSETAVLRKEAEALAAKTSK